MKFGLFYELQLPTPWQDGDITRVFKQALEHVVLGDKLGFDCLWAVEHHFLEDHSLSSSPATWLAAAAALTSRIRIGHGICCTPPNFVHPARLAEHIATLDQTSAGRVEFGTGESASRMELEGFGVDPATKREAWAEAVEQIANMLAMTPYPGFDGEFFSMPCRNLVPKPAQKPHPPLWVAGKPDLAAERGMGCLGFNVLSGPQAKLAVDQYYQTLAERCTPIGHAINPNIAVLALFHVHRDETIARERGAHLDFFGFSIARYYLQGKVRPGRSNGWAEFQSIKDGFPGIAPDNPTSAIGSVAQVREHLLALEAAGVDQVLLMHQGGRMEHEWNCESLELFARELLPEFQERDERRQREKQDRIAPIEDAAMKRKTWMRELSDDEIPIVEPYGKASFIPDPDEVAAASGVSDDTKGALGIGTR